MPFGQLLVEGLAIGACYGLFATAVVIIYKTSEVVNFAQGEMAMFSTFVAFHILTIYEYPFWLAFILLRRLPVQGTVAWVRSRQASQQRGLRRNDREAASPASRLTLVRMTPTREPETGRIIPANGGPLQRSTFSASHSGRTRGFCRAASA